MHERVLLPIDNHEGTDAAVEYGLELANQHGATVHLLHVTESLPGGGAFHEGVFGDNVGPEEIENAVRRHAEEVLQPYVERADAAGVDVVTDVVSGSPYKRILAYVDDADIDVIVMGTRGRTGIGRPLLGGVTERVVRLSDVPVVTIPLRD
jgi:nucleotide-binding universal stress UspA family protein